MGLPRDRTLLAFVHIEKAAGTTLIHVLRHNFFLRYLDVRPYSPSPERIFRASDLALALRINPGLACIGGHSVRPYSDLAEVVRSVRYVTVLRDPVRRYVSMYQYWTEMLGKQMTFEEFLSDPETHDFQTRKIVGRADAAAAEQLLAEEFFLVGVVERLDEFLIQLGARLAPRPFDARYRLLNTARERKEPRSEDYAETRREAIASVNAHDQRLYAFVNNHILPAQRAGYGGTLDQDVAAFQRHNREHSVPMTRRYADYMARKLYFEPVTGLVRRYNGMEWYGSY
ncbi:sulfotransferase family 2 domain-containing protein [Halochromatium glycolicum]|uniref:Sulfotransferase family protein n=1 Tax=Halochromatium glycolicum TaxID=85075 RepID=A0AAJ0U6T3_9GAMM|nr:sulfotransferase family 2 domain-containing protein [Halochromatium glycolicum]MBK1706380.1 hypothetical protein [Halochromatium glycolicum]